MKRATLLAGLAAAAVPRPARAQALVPLLLATAPGTAPAPVIYAQQTGLFKAAGLAIEIHRMGSGAAITSAVVGGSLQIGSGNLFSIVTAHARGIPVELVCGGPLYRSTDPVPFCMMMVRKDSPIHAAPDLNGKTLALTTAKADLNAVTTQAWVEKNGGDWSSMHVLEVPQEAMVPALEEGRVDSITMQSPLCQEAMATGKVRMLTNPYAMVGPRFYIASWFAQSDWAGRNADTIHRFLDVMDAASAYANAHYDAMIPILASYLHLAPSIVEKASRALFVPRLAVGDIQPIVDLEARYKVIDRAFDAREVIAPAAA